MGEVEYTKGLQVNTYTGKYRCERCNVIGIAMVEMTFPIPSPRCSERTKEKFKTKRQKDHHDGFSLLVDLLNLDMVQDFPLDLVCLGTVWRLI